MTGDTSRERAGAEHSGGIDVGRGVFVTGTGTGVGKSVLAATICAGLAARGERVAALKPAVTGLDEEPGEWPHDHELLAAAGSAGQSPDEVAPYRFGPAVSPHYAAELSGASIDVEALLRAARDAGEGSDALVVEGVGGLMVPLTPEYLVRDFAADLALPIVIAARTRLGTINHTLLTLEAGRSSGLRVGGVVMTPWSDDPEPIERSNRATVERLGRARVTGLPPTNPELLAEAACVLPLEEWLSPGRSSAS
jgi:dethiobiotin synthetase